jgi:hypothetical protein
MVKTDESGGILQWPYSEFQLKIDNPNTSFPKKMDEEGLASWNVYPVTVNEPPSHNETTHISEVNAAPELVNGSWVLNSTVREKTEEELTEWNDLSEATKRSLRKSKLEETDFYALSDVTMSPEMATYRQALRDITAHSNWPNLDDTDWPTKP